MSAESSETDAGARPLSTCNGEWHEPTERGSLRSCGEATAGAPAPCAERRLAWAGGGGGRADPSAPSLTHLAYCSSSACAARETPRRGRGRVIITGAATVRAARRAAERLRGVTPLLRPRATDRPDTAAHALRGVLREKPDDE
eukprot:scaffold644_cov353-Prasinococcus_capsulatus_cf.AAC.13